MLNQDLQCRERIESSSLSPTTVYSQDVTPRPTFKSSGIKDLGLLTGLLLTSLYFLLPSPTIAQSSVPPNPLSTSFEFVPDMPPGSDRGSPEQQVDLGSRGPSKEGYLTALVPADGVALTTSAHPSFWVYVPSGMDDVESMELFLRHYQTGEVESFEVQPTPSEAQSALSGVVELPLPSVAAPLAIGERYDWSLMVTYQRSSDGAFPVLTDEDFVVASIVRQAPTTDLERDLAQADAAWEQAVVYGKHGIWHEALTVLGTARQTDPNHPDFVMAWSHLLAFVNLEAHPYFPFAQPFDSTILSQKAMIQCCQVTP